MWPILLTLVLLTVAGQVPRDRSAVPRQIVGSAIASGIVTLGDEARTPVRRATVTLAPTDGGEPRSTVSNDEGRFSLEGLPRGTYALYAEKAAHPAMAFGAHRPGRRGTHLVLADGQHLPDLHLILPRGAVIAGRLTFDDGRPVGDVEVVAIPSRLASAGGTPSPSLQEFRTDDDGRFRIYGLPPGTYIVGALPQFGRGEIERRTSVEVDALLRSLTRQASASDISASVRRDSTLVGFAPVYYPGIATSHDAHRIELRTGDVREDVDFAVSLLPTATVRGVVTAASGAPVEAVTITAEVEGPPLPLEFTVARIRLPNSNGEFSITGLTPGRYVLRARSGGVTLGAGGQFSVRSSAQTEWARTDLHVAGVDIDGVQLTLGPGLSFGGTLSAPSSEGVSWLGTVVTVHPVRDGVNTAMAGLTGGVTARTATADRDGRFVVTGLEPDTYFIEVRLPSALVAEGWNLASVLHHGRDLRDTPLTFSDGSIAGVEVVFTTDITELSGLLTHESRHAATEYFIVLFPEDRSLWHPASPRTELLRPAIDGRFSTRKLPPGAYRMAALIDVEAYELRDRAFLESVYEASLPVVLTEGRVTTQDIRVK